MTPPIVPPYFWEDAHLISCALSFGAGLATGLWLGFKLWRETYMRKWRDLKMRVQVYQEELGPGVELIEQTSRNGEHFYGLRIWLNTCQALLDHSTPEDDDRSAVTFWASAKGDLATLLAQMAGALDCTVAMPPGLHP